MEKNVKSVKPMSNEEFAHAMDTMRKAKAMLPLEFFLGILSDIVKNSDKDNNIVKMLAEEFKKNNEPVEGIISKTVLTVANSTVISIWNLFGPKLEELAKEKEVKVEKDLKA